MEKIGTKKMQICYDKKMHETTLTDYLVKLYGSTYQNRNLIRKLGFHFCADGTPHWEKNVESELELVDINIAIHGSNIEIYSKPVYRITDTETNPLGR